MGNQTQEEKIEIIFTALSEAGENGLTVDEITEILFEGKANKKSQVKKLLDKLKSKSNVKTGSRGGEQVYLKYDIGG